MLKIKINRPNRFEVSRNDTTAAAIRGYSDPDHGDNLIGLTPLIPDMGKLTRREQDKITRAELNARRRARLLIEAARDQDRIDSGESLGGTRVEQVVRGALAKVGLAEVVSREEVDIVRAAGMVEQASPPDRSPIKFVDTPQKE
jgi:hypothetical protein